MLTPTPIADVAKGGDHLVFRDEDNYTANATRAEFIRCHFENLGLKDATFEGARLKNCRLERCYLRNTVFRGADLTGTQFCDCNLRHASFDASQLWYVTFDRCDLDYGALLDNLPPQHNLRRHLLRSLRMNALDRGDTLVARRILLKELEAERMEQYGILTGETTYFKENFTTADRINALGTWILHNLSRHFWGYGLRVAILLRSAAAVVLLFAVAYASGAQFLIASESEVRGVSLMEALYMSAVTFSTLGSGNYAPMDALGRTGFVVESLAGAVFIGLLAATVYRLIRR